MGYEGVDWVHLAKDIDNWRAVVYAVLNFLIPYKGEDIFVQLKDSQRLCETHG